MTVTFQNVSHNKLAGATKKDSSNSYHLHKPLQVNTSHYRLIKSSVGVIIELCFKAYFHCLLFTHRLSLFYNHRKTYTIPLLSTTSILKRANERMNIIKAILKILLTFPWLCGWTETQLSKVSLMESPINICRS